VARCRSNWRGGAASPKRSFAGASSDGETRTRTGDTTIFSHRERAGGTSWFAGGTHRSGRAGYAWIPVVSCGFRPRARGSWPKPREPVPRPLRQTSRPVDLWFRSTHTTSRAGSSERCSPLSRDDSSAAKAWSWPAQRADVGHASVSACAASGRRLPSAGVRPRSRVRAVSRRAPNAWVDCCRHAGSAARARQSAVLSRSTSRSATATAAS
jgi:hypothetical protein